MLAETFYAYPQENFENLYHGLPRRMKKWVAQRDICRRFCLLRLIYNNLKLLRVQFRFSQRSNLGQILCAMIVCVLIFSSHLLTI